MKRTCCALLVPALAVILSFSGTPLFAHGEVDQSNPVAGGGTLILGHMPIGQEFIPTQPVLVGVDVIFRGSDGGADLITVNIRQGTMSTPVLASTSQVVAPCPFAPPLFSCTVHFDFLTPLQVTPGEIYVLEVQATQGFHAWQADAPAGDYPVGTAIIQGVVNPIQDYGFQTYFQSVLVVNVDVKPGGFPNSVNPKSQGVIPVAILTTDTFDATTVDPLTVRFGPAGASEAHGRAHAEDVDGDGDLDLVLHFRVQEAGIQCGDVSAFLDGATLDGQEIEGADALRTVGCR